jgi:type IV secretory pathway VirB10-like protein
MNPNRLAVAALGFICVSAAAGGGYLASRRHPAPEPVAVAATATLPSQSPTATVHETEAVVGDVAKPAPASPSAVEAVSTRPVQERRTAPRPQTRRTEPIATRSSPPPVLDRTWPSSASAPVAESAQAPAVNESSQTPATLDDRAVAESRPIEPPKEPAKIFNELVVSANSVVGLQLDSAISTDRARVEDRIEARVVRDVRVGSDVAIPAGAQAMGSVMAVERGGKFKERARLGIRFHTLVLGDGTRLPITTETIYRYGESPTNESAAKIGGGAVAGAILGAIIGGAKGAAVGATAGAGGGTAAVMAGGTNHASFPAGTEVTARILSPVTVTVEK